MNPVHKYLVKRDRCPVCGETGSFRKLYDLAAFSVFECSCSSRFIDPSLTAEGQMAIYSNSETLKEINPALEQYYEYQTLRPGSRTWQDYSRALRELEEMTRGRTILEIGCGGGSFLQTAAERGWQAAGVDSSAENIAALEARGLKGFAQNFTDFVAPEPFDVVVLWDLIEHPQEPVALLERCRTWLKPGGLLLIATPQDPNLLSRLADVFFKISGGRIKFPLNQLYVIEHTSYLNCRSLGALLEAGGFETTRTWKTETDLSRYHFSPLMRIALHCAFFLARLLGLQNRLMAIARRMD